MYSRHYNTEDRITSLLRKVSNEIIIVCCKKISLPDVFDGNVEASIHHLEQSIQCGVSWKEIYRKAVKAVNAAAPSPDRRWNFDETGIFAQIDAFVQRCRELLEVCEGQIQFARKGKGGKREDLPTFGGNRGMDIVKSLRGIEAQFEGHVDRLRQLDYDILDVKITSWHSDFNSFKNGMKDLEAMTQNVINGAFESISTVATGVDMIRSFQKIAQREAIKRCVEKRTIDIFGMFKTNIAAIRNLFEKNKHAPILSPTEPQFAGAALWGRSLLLRATDDLVRLQELVDPSNAAECDEAQNAYDGLRLVVNEYIQRKYHDWIEDLNTLGNSNMNSRLENPLMTKTGSDPDSTPASVNLNSHNKDNNALQNTEKTLIGRAKKGFLHCNFDRPLLNLFSEVHYWQYFNGEIQIPYMAHDICNQKEQLRVLREHVMLVVRDYNRILLDLSSTERRLFEDIIRKLDRRIQPGLQKLTWVSKGIVEWYVADCRKHCETTYKIVQEFQENKDIVMKNCKMISGLMHIFIERNTIYDDGVFEAKQVIHRKTIEKQLREAYQTISNTMTATYEHFASGPPEVQREWNRFVERSDKMLEDALRQSVKKSLQELSKAINGDAKTDPRPLFRIHVVLEDNKVEFKPFMSDLTQMVNTVAKEIFNVISVVPRLVASLPRHHNNNQTNPENLAVNADGKFDSAAAKGEEVRAPDTASGEPTGNQKEAMSNTDTADKVDAPAVVNNFFQSIFNDEEILKVLVHIMNGMSSSATELQ
ncbi:Dynein heavy chain, partial [Phytophthora palmivora]